MQKFEGIHFYVNVANFNEVVEYSGYHVPAVRHKETKKNV